ncbi:glucokinase [Geomicrobium halophilum]|uniref:Glucokinase n=1 Tax=Geomicrobium halophilum TaxID=549000 RepID=A0A841Q0G2_9BACL|nr:ROK family glucokinase [Geomicrobium halophilum]MBB6448878.1 glucokinase [Geomicrobium halophilum]
MAEYIVGIDVGGTTTKFGILTTTGENIGKWKIHTHTENDGKNICSHIKSSIQEYCRENQIPKSKLAGVGVGVPGFVEEGSGMVNNAVNIGWKDYPLQSTLEELLDLPVFINNDANLAAAGEYWQGAAKMETSTLCITLGTGVGGGVILNGDVVTGPSGTAGEIGHFLVVPHGRICTCGREGCLEEYVASKGLRRSLLDHLRNPAESTQLDKSSEAIDIFKAAEEGDRLANRIVNEATYYLAYVLANTVVLFNPEKIIIGGGMSAAKETLLQPLVAHFKRFVLTEADQHLSFGFAQLGNDAGIYGASWLAAKRLGYIDD